MGAKQNKRITRGNWYYQLAKVTAKRSTCLRKQVGCVLVVDGRPIMMGYNGVLPNQTPETGLDEFGNSRTVHAEANAIAFCAKKGIATEGAIVYCTLQPCEKCAELLIQAGITEVHYWEEYRDDSGLKKLKENNIKCYYKYAECL